MTGASNGPVLTRSIEDYLKAIYELEQDGSPAQTSAIAGALDVAPPSVSGMVKRLSDKHAPAVSFDPPVFDTAVVTDETPPAGGF